MLRPHRGGGGVTGCRCRHSRRHTRRTTAHTPAQNRHRVRKRVHIIKTSPSVPALQREPVWVPHWAPQFTRILHSLKYARIELISGARTVVRFLKPGSKIRIWRHILSRIGFCPNATDCRHCGIGRCTDLNPQHTPSCGAH